jgi:hypothetical protein
VIHNHDAASFIKWHYKTGVRIRGAWLKLGETVRQRWSSYERAKYTTMDSMDEGGLGRSVDSGFDYDGLRF